MNRVLDSDEKRERTRANLLVKGRNAKKRRGSGGRVPIKRMIALSKGKKTPRPNCPCRMRREEEAKKKTAIRTRQSRLRSGGDKGKPS